LKIDNADGFAPLPLRQPDQPIGATEEIMICGYPFGVQLRIDADRRFVPSVFMGTVSSVQAAGTDHERVFIDCAAKSGNSGSPVISRTDGTVIGMLDASHTNQSGKLVEELNFFTPIRMAWERFIRR
ncbi:MAG: serine protease, partial [Candidatus Spyradocola sp.]